MPSHVDDLWLGACASRMSGTFACYGLFRGQILPYCHRNHGMYTELEWFSSVVKNLAKLLLVLNETAKRCRGYVCQNIHKLSNLPTSSAFCSDNVSRKLWNIACPERYQDTMCARTHRRLCFWDVRPVRVLIGPIHVKTGVPGHAPTTLHEYGL